MAKANKASKQVRKLNGTQVELPGGKRPGMAKPAVSPRTVLSAIRREQQASHASLTARLDYLLATIK